MTANKRIGRLYRDSPLCRAPAERRCGASTSPDARLSQPHCGGCRLRRGEDMGEGHHQEYKSSAC